MQNLDFPYFRGFDSIPIPQKCNDQMRMRTVLDWVEFRRMFSLFKQQHVVGVGSWYMSCSAKSEMAICSNQTIISDKEWRRKNVQITYYFEITLQFENWCNNHLWNVECFVLFPVMAGAKKSFLIHRSVILMELQLRKSGINICKGHVKVGITLSPCFVSSCQYFVFTEDFPTSGYSYVCLNGFWLCYAWRCRSVSENQKKNNGLKIFFFNSYYG